MAERATTDLAQITLTCNQIEAVADQASTTLAQLRALSDNWSIVAATTQQSAADWANGGSAALQCAAQMVKLTFGSVTRLVDAFAVNSKMSSR